MLPRHILRGVVTGIGGEVIAAVTTANRTHKALAMERAIAVLGIVNVEGMGALALRLLFGEARVGSLV